MTEESNTQFENDFASTEAAAPSTNAAEEMTAATEATLSEITGDPVAVSFAGSDEIEAEEGDDEEDDFFAESAVENVPVVDPNRVITLTPSSAKDVIVELQEGEAAVPMIDLIKRSGLQFKGDFTCFLNGAELKLTDVVPAASSVVIAGAVKGGSDR